MEEAINITKKRLDTWHQYHTILKPLEDAHYLRRPAIPEECQHNAHMYYLLVSDEKEKQNMIKHLRNNGICSLFHYMPLHLSTAGRKYTKTSGSLKLTENLSGRVIRLPLWIGLSEKQIERICDSIRKFYERPNR